MHLHKKLPSYELVVFISILFVSVGFATYNVFADTATEMDHDHSHSYNMTNGVTQKQGYAYPSHYSMPGFNTLKKDDQWDHHDNTKSNQTNCAGESLVSYVGNGATNSTLVRHNLGALPRVTYILDLTNPPASNVDGITTIVSTTGIVYVESGNDAYAPIPISNTNIVNATAIDVGQIFNKITQEEFFSKAVNSNGTNYEMISLNFAGNSCNSSSHSSDYDDDH